ncbi:MAG: DNA-packaging protein [Alphaproteobacteria bacterium]
MDDSKVISEIIPLLKQEIKSRELELEKYDWAKQARPNQLLPRGDWRTWMILAGRGFGKTRAGAEAIRHWVESGKCRRICLLAQTDADARHVMIEGDSGLLNICPPNNRPSYSPSTRTLTWPCGAIAQTFSADCPDQLRGPQFDGAWIDELAKFKNPQASWDQLGFALRLGNNPQAIVTTTPRPHPLVKQLMTDKTVHITRGSTFDNAANLSQHFLDHMQERFKGTRYGAQELFGDIIEDTDGALWSKDLLDRSKAPQEPNDLARVVIAIDPATTHTAKSDETGVMVVGLGSDGIGYVLEDLSGRYPPHEWARKAVTAYKRYSADRVVAEINKGGDLVERVIRSIDENVSFKAVRATRGKVTRAEPIAALYEQGRVKHIATGLAELEKQLISYIPGVTSKSPDRLDALVWGLTDLMLEKEATLSPKAWLA